MCYNFGLSFYDLYEDFLWFLKITFCFEIISNNREFTGMAQMTYTFLCCHGFFIWALYPYIHSAEPFENVHHAFPCTLNSLLFISYKQSILKITV